MKEIFDKIGLNLDENALKKFELYYNALITFNQKFNITAITEKTEVYNKHFADSLLGTKFIEGGNLIDVGSGGGFPGIPLKILNPNLKVTLLDATEKKCSFLREVVKILNLKDVTVICGRAEELGKLSLREKFDYATARAVGRLNGLLEYTLPLVKLNGSFICYKGIAEEEVKEAENAIKKLGGIIEKREKFELDYGVREIIVIKKQSHCPAVYPRAYAKIKKSPL